MKKRAKKLMKSMWCMLLVLVMVGGLMACGGGTDAPKDTDADVQNETGEDKNQEAQEPSGDGAGADAGGINLEGYPIVNEPVTVRIMGLKHPIQGEWKDLKFFQRMEEMTGITLEFDTPALDVYEEKKSLAITGDTYPDVFFGGMLTPNQQVEWGMTEGILIPLNDLIEEYAPHVQAMFDANPGVKASVTAPDGNIYALPQINAAPIAYTVPVWYNGDWLKALNITEDQLPTDLDGFYELLKRFREEDPNGNGEADEIPLSLVSATGKPFGAEPTECYILPAFGINGSKIYVDDNGVVKYGALEENYKEYVKYLKKLYDEKLLDNDFVTADTVSVTAQAKNNQVGMAVSAIPQNMWDVDTEQAKDYPIIRALGSEYTGGKPVCTYINSPIQQGTFAITDKCQCPEAMMRWVDYLYSEEGSIYIHYGDEGDFWEFADSGLRKHIEHEGMANEEYRGGVITPDCGTPCPKWVRPETEGSWEDPFQAVRIAVTDEQIVPYMKQVFPQTYFSTEDADRITVIQTDLDKYMEETVAGFIVGSMDIDAQWDEFQATLKQMGAEELVSLHQASYDNWVAANK